MIESRDQTMNDRIRELYVDHALEQAAAGILDHALTNAIDPGMTLDEAMIHVLRAAGKLPADAGDARAATIPGHRPG